MNLPNHDAQTTYGGESEPETWECAGCGEKACEDDPEWRNKTWHLECLDWNDLRDAVVAGTSSDACHEAAWILSGAKGFAARQVKAAHDYELAKAAQWAGVER